MRSTIGIHPRGALARVYDTPGWPGEPNIGFRDPDTMDDLTIYLRSPAELIQLRDAINAYLESQAAQAPKATTGCAELAMSEPQGAA